MAIDRSFTKLANIVCSRLLIFVLFANIVTPTYAFSVLRLSPSGESIDVKQVFVKFSEPMVAFGDPRGEDPGKLICTGITEQELQNQIMSKRWLGADEYSIEFKEHLKSGVSCSFQLREGLKSYKGNVLNVSQKYSFNTSGPVVKSFNPDSDRMDEDSSFLLELSGPMDAKSLEGKAYFVVQGVAEKIPFRLEPDSVTKQLLLTRYFRKSKSSFVTITPVRKLPSGSTAKFVWGAGIKSETGLATTKSQEFKFKTKEPFIVTMNCVRESSSAPCTPLGEIRISFNDDVEKKKAAGIKLVDKSGRAYSQTVVSDNYETTTSVAFAPPFAPDSELTLSLPKEFTDHRGRAVSNAKNFPLKFKTNRLPPLAKFAAPFGIIEATKDASLPVTVRNMDPKIAAKLGVAYEPSGSMGKKIFGFEFMKGSTKTVQKPEEIIYWLDRLDAIERGQSIFDGAPVRANAGKQRGARVSPEGTKFSSFELPKIESDQDTMVVGIPMPKKGFHVVELASNILGKTLMESENPMYVPAATLVTDLAVNFKLAKENSLAWVTRLQDATPVRGAVIQVVDCHGKLLKEGKTDALGAVILSSINHDLDKIRCDDMASYQYARGYFVFASFEGDMTFTHTSWTKGIEPYRFGLYPDWRANAGYAVHSILDRTLFRAGETVHIKHVIRDKTGLGFKLRDQTSLPSEYKIHFKEDEIYKAKLDWRTDGTAVSTFKIPMEAKLGSYWIEIAGGDGYNRIVTSTFRVEEFRLAQMKATVVPQEDLIRPTTLKFPVQISYFAGGGASGLPVRMRGVVHPRSSLSFPNYDAYQFDSMDIKLGLQSKDNYQELEEEQTEEEVQSGSSSSQGKNKILAVDLTLDEKGAATAEFTKIPKEANYVFEVEAEYRDPNGEVQVASSRAEVFKNDIVLGMKTKGWTNSNEAVKINMVAVDVKGHPQSNVGVEVDIFKRQTFYHRKKIVGGFYSFESSTEITKVEGNFCKGTSDNLGLMFCEKVIKDPGEYILRAKYKDKGKREGFATAIVYVYGDRFWTGSDANSDQFTIFPEKKEYEPNEAAVFHLRSPFEKATALVTVEREGVLQHFVETVSGSNPKIKIPLKGYFAPNVFISVFLARGRIDDVVPTAMVDLGKPSFKMGMSEIRVGWGAHRLKVQVDPEGKSFKPRDKVKTRIRVSTPDGSPLKSHSVLVLAVDEGLLQMSPNGTWDLLKAMMENRYHEVSTSTSQIQVIGKRHLGLKALPTGGGGGSSPRKLFDTLLTWQDQVPLKIVSQDVGEASVTIPLNDSLTSFKIVAIASANTGMFGTGDSSITSSQDLLMFSGLPPEVRNTDQFDGIVTLRNTSKNKLQLEFNASVKIMNANDPKEKSDGINLPTQSVGIDPDQTKEIFWKYKVPDEGQKLFWNITAVNQGKVIDSLEINQKVTPAVPMRTLQATLLQVSGESKQDVVRPSDAIKNRGGLRINLASSLGQQGESAVEYMKNYPYSCLEQRVSRAVSLNDAAQWASIDAGLSSYLDANGLATYFPGMRFGSEVLTSYLISIAHAADYRISYNTLMKMRSGLIAWYQGKIRYDYNNFQAADLPIRRVAALKAIFLSDPKIFDDKLIESLDVNPNIWPSEAVLDWIEMLEKGEKIPSREKRLKEAYNALAASLHQEGSSTNFSETYGRGFSWLMTSRDSNQARLLYSVVDVIPQNRKVAEAGRVVAALMAQMKQGHWDLTTANAWALLALRKFVAKFESAKVTGSTIAILDRATMQHDWQKSKQASLMLPMNTEKSILNLSQKGTGSPWVMVASQFAIPLTKQYNSGMSVSRTVIPIEQKVKGSWSRGDLYKVEVAMTTSSAQSWVVLFDPIPTGSAIIGGVSQGNLTSALGSRKTSNNKSDDALYISPSYVENSFAGPKAYYEYVPLGKWTFSYMVRLNQDGEFAMPPTRLESMYAPAMFGETPVDTWKVTR